MQCQNVPNYAILLINLISKESCLFYPKCLLEIDIVLEQLPGNRKYTSILPWDIIGVIANYILILWADTVVSTE